MRRGAPRASMASSTRPGPLAGRAVLVTRPEGRGDALAERLTRLGARVELRPTIAFEAPRDRAAVREAVGRLDRYDWVVLSSPTGVRFFTREAPAAAGGGTPARLRIAVIGPGTAAAAERAGLAPALVARDSRSEGLAAELCARGVAGTRVLLVRPETARPVLIEELESAGAAVDAVAFYRTVPHPGAAETAARVAGGRYTVAVFSSPSTLRSLLDAAGAALPACRRGLAKLLRIAIGPVTAAALAAEGLPADRVARSPDDAAVAEAVCEAAAD